MQIVVLDSKPFFSDDIDLSALKKLGVVSLYPRTEQQLVRQRLRGADIVLTNKVALDRDVLLETNGLKLICLLGNDLSLVDIEAASEKGIRVCYVPDYASREIAQYAMALLMEMCFHIGFHERKIHMGAWCSSQDYCWYEKAPVSLIAKTAGIIGCGAVGCECAKLFRAFGMRIKGYDCQQNKSDIFESVTLGNLIETADVILLSCPVSSDKEGFINADLIARMKTGALLINVSSGKLVAEKDIVNALENGRIGGYATDTIAVEPISVHNPLLKAPNCVISAHCSDLSISSRKRLLEIAVNNISSFLGGNPINLAN